ncbi:hypothetical protein [Emticicia sp. 21SJ11W-3]|uniref:hypothetical protein n=1 Tax=Emticicia sp. 21SJ11W-3 TaxID=2916755 RepID=UPI00209F4851|nr:hypothetical protein [Emticicia sp. 21SJ11W-3]UTA66669.1 hypothetical protein MB380_13770 [Emticicia sp. 21SJ11W-3]
MIKNLARTIPSLLIILCILLYKTKVLDLNGASILLVVAVVVGVYLNLSGAGSKKRRRF